MSRNIIIHCQNLRDRDIISISDPRCRVVLVDVRNNHREVLTLGTTETIKNNVNPQFKTRIRIPNQYFIGNGHLFKFNIEDVDNGRNDKVGSCFIAPHDIANSGANGVSRKLDGNGRLTVFLDDQTQGMLSFIFRGIKIASMDFIGKSDPYFQIFQDNMSLYRSEHVDNTKNPKWKGFHIGMNRINMNKECTVRVYDYDGPNMNSDFIGQCSFTPANVQNSGRELELLSGKGKCKGYLCIDQCQIIKNKPPKMNTTHFQPSFNRFQSVNPQVNPYPTVPQNHAYPNLQHQNSVPYLQHHNTVPNLPNQHYNNPQHTIPPVQHNNVPPPVYPHQHASAPPPTSFVPQNTPYSNPHLYANPNIPSNTPYTNPNLYPNQNQFHY